MKSVREICKGSCQFGMGGANIITALLFFLGKILFQLPAHLPHIDGDRVHVLVKMM